ncbi:hypothetical protein VTK73DRAFT_9446 [Phialemonium thermophilum]|uniref:Uncharacterized protein n=1 Tax=Phialemonium thermophilum TaxID=223376 RepID=A0ABR3XK66_9PEZI
MAFWSHFLTGSAWSTSKSKPDSRDLTKFFGSQIGGKSVINYAYTDMPGKLLAFDVYYFFTFAWAIPYILLPLTPADSGELDELSLTLQNVFCIFIHVILCALQLAFILALPLSVLLPVWTVVLGAACFFLVNQALCSLLNGRKSEYHSDPEYAPRLPEHDHEQWIFINGVAVGEHWMKNNLNRLAVTFRRPVLGIHNRTNGIIFDVVECLVQRSFGFATSDVRICYSIIKEKLYDPRYSKIIFILHSQGGIEGSMVLDWLLQELPQDLLSKIEVYTFGNAANHFNNPHRLVGSQEEAFRRPVLGSLDATRVDFMTSPTAESAAEQDNRPPTPTTPREPVEGDDNSTAGPIRSSLNKLSLLSETSSVRPTLLSDRAIGHIEHYAHTTDFVALWGVLHFATSKPRSHLLPRFIGRVFARTSARGGHQLCHHYLDGMFPLARDPATGAFLGAADGEGENAFMESEVTVGVEGDEMDNAREALEFSYATMGIGGVNLNEAPLRRLEREVEIHSVDDRPPESRGRYRHRRTGRTGALTANVKVKDLSRLWQYRNGLSPGDKAPFLASDATGLTRIATL